MKRLTKLPLYLGMAVLVMSLVVAVSVSQKNTITQQTSHAAVGSTSLSLNPAASSFRIGESATVAISISSSQNIGGVDLVLDYNHFLGQVDEKSIMGSNKFSLVRANVDANRGVLTASFIANNPNGESNAFIGSFGIKAFKPGDMSLSIDNSSKIVAAGSLNIISSSLGGVNLHFNQ